MSRQRAWSRFEQSWQVEPIAAMQILLPILNDLTAQRVLYEERGKYFTLAIPENPYL